MSPFDIGKTAPVHPVRASVGEKSVPREAPPTPAREGTGAGVRVDLATGAADSSAPVDHERVAKIRAALRDGTYPIVPAKIADAMIAARLTLGGQA